jgi:hypothetical protein
MPNGKYDSLFTSAPVLFPWYCSEHFPRIIKSNSTLLWKYKQKTNDTFVGIMQLYNNKHQCLGLIKIYNYLLSNDIGSFFLLWNRSNRNNKEFTEQTFFLFSTDELGIIDNVDDICKNIKDDISTQFYLNCKPTSTIKLKFNAEQLDFAFPFPPEYIQFNEFCIVLDIPNLYKESNFNNTAIAIINTEFGNVQVFPQDWFNKSDYDFGYQWITRAIRNTNDGNIYGQGIRINEFILDETNRQLKAR